MLDKLMPCGQSVAYWSDLGQSIILLPIWVWSAWHHASIDYSGKLGVDGCEIWYIATIDMVRVIQSGCKVRDPPRNLIDIFWYLL